MNTNVVVEGLDQVPGLNLLPHAWQGWVLILAFFHPYVTRGFFALRNGGGLKGLVSAIWIGAPAAPAVPAAPAAPAASQPAQKVP